MKPAMSSSRSAAPEISWLPAQWAELLTSWGYPAYRARQVFRWIQARGVFDPERFSDVPRALRARLAGAGLRAPLAIADDRLARDGTRKLLVEMHDARRVETVLIPEGSVAEEDPALSPAGRRSPDAVTRVTQCISSQVGCAMGCGFCASGLAGLKRQMTAAEIVAQVLLGKALLGEDARLSRVVYMGMGEPLHNYDAVARSIELLTHAEGVGLSPRRVTVSTSGLVPEIERLGRDFGGRVQLAVSLHAPDSATRRRIMPIENKYPLPRLIDALGRYPCPKRDRMTIEYILIAGVNDSPAHAVRLARLLAPLPVKINLIPMNPVPRADLGAPEPAAVQAFQDELRQRDLHAFVRRRRGDDIVAACGQLALRGERPRVRTWLT